MTGSEWVPKAQNLDCIHCGLCLSACPTYTRTWKEADSPRGRIYLMKAAGEGRIPFNHPVLGEHLDLCLGCRACESACPSGVQYEQLLVGARAEMARLHPHRGLGAFLGSLALRHLLPFPSRLRRCFQAARLLQRLGAARLSSSLPPTSVWSRLLRQLDGIPAAGGATSLLHGRHVGHPAGRRRVLFFRGCVMNELFHPAQKATLRLLQASGCDVEVLPGQTCCGALHYHHGDIEQARRLAEQNIEALGSDEDAVVVTNSAGCGAMLKQYPHLFAHASQTIRDGAQRFGSRVRDFSEFLAGISGDLALGPLQARVTYDDPCHLLHGQRVADAPRILLRRIPGIRYTELPRASVCCGAAGTYNLSQPAMSEQILRSKMEDIASTGADVVVTANPGCLLQLRSGAAAAGMRVEVLHLAEILERALDAGEGSPCEGGQT